MQQLAVPVPFEIQREARSYFGTGTTQSWYRWGYVLAPAGYSWAGSQEAFPSDAQYTYVIESATAKELTTASSADACTGTWTRKSASALSLGILPVFHA
jgi:hypothetical protein